LLTLASERRLAMISLEGILDSKGHELYVVSPTDTALHAVEVMCREHVGAVLVMDGDVLAGIFSERDLMTRVVLARRDPTDCRVGEVMTSRAVCAPLDATLHDALSLMTYRRVRHVPVVDRRGRVVGVVSMGDLVACTARDRENEIEQLHQYVSGRYPG